MNRADLLALCSEGVELAKRSGADAAEVAATFAAGSSIDLEKNDLHMASADDEVTYGVRVIKGGAVGFANSNDPGTLRDSVADALVIAAAGVPDPHHHLPEPREFTRIAGLHDPAVAALGVEDVTALGYRMLERVRARDARASIDTGNASCVVGRRAIVSSTGVNAYDETTRLSCSLFGMAVEGDRVSSFVHEGESARAVAGFSDLLDAAADRFVDKAVGALGARKGESYQGLVLFSPEAVESVFVENLLAMMAASALRKGKSLLCGKLGSVVADTCLTLRDDGTRPGAVGSSSFDREGLPHRPMDLVARGVFNAIPYNSYEARAAGIAGGSTGHAAGGSSSPPVVGVNELEIPAGDATSSELLARLDRVVMVTRFSGSSNAVTGEFSGVVKAGHLWIKGDKVPITETLISGNMLEALARITAVSKDRVRLSGHHLMPWLLVDGISVTAG